MNRIIGNVRIQSKSGNFNRTERVWLNDETAEWERPLIERVLSVMRSRGSYAAEYKGKWVQVPFEEVEYIEWVSE